ncbi:MAG: PQQ-binding-like beta-propeller repeat protein [Thermoguttaceae bacterium]|jgi:outer membrane protein assembly factor BamB
MKFLLGFLIPAAMAVAGIVLLVTWAGTGPAYAVRARLPGQDGVPPPAAVRPPQRPQPGEPVCEPHPAPIRPSKITAAWPWFRGPDGDAISKETIRLARRWPASGPPRLWTVPLGEGFAAAAIEGGCVYVLDHVHDSPIDLLRGLADEDRSRLADALAPISPGDVGKLRGLVRSLLEHAPQAAAEASAQDWPAKYAALEQDLAALLLDRRDDLLRALRQNTLDDIDRSADTMRCLSLDTGGEIWRNGYPVVIPSHHGMSRTVPAVIGNRVVSLGPMCHVACWDTATGKALWLLDLVLDYGATVPPWYAGQCPLIDVKTDRLILAPGGKALVMAVDYRTGKVLWQSPNPRGWTMTHVSVVPAELAGRRMYVYCGKGGVAGIAADTGELLWDTTEWQIGTATCPSPVVVGPGRIFFSGGYNVGSLMLQLQQEAGRIVPETLFRLTAKQFGSEQQTPIFWRGNLYGVRQKDQQLVCLDLEGRELWNSGREKFGSAPYLIADGLIYVLDDNGVLTMAEAAAAGYHRLARAEVLDGGVTSWGPMALAGGRLIVRDLTRMICLDVAEH